jgi:dTDP-4-amino-4,6-dideoxygalactose transaminase
MESRKHALVQSKALISMYTGHPHVWLTTRGNEAIRYALICARTGKQGGVALIPDQAGWLSYRTLPKKVGLSSREIPTDNGIIDLDGLKKALDHSPACLLYQNPAGYFAEQPIIEIYSLCEGRCLVIMDVSGSLGDQKLCDGSSADILVGSFGTWKTVEVGYGGFISCRDALLAERIGRSIEESGLKGHFDERHLPLLLERLEQAPALLRRQHALQDQVKHDLAGHDIVHPEKVGTNVIVRFAQESEKTLIISYCEKHKYEYTLCPRYIRVLAPAVSIECKRLR